MSLQRAEEDITLVRGGEGGNVPNTQPHRISLRATAIMQLICIDGKAGWNEIGGNSGENLELPSSPGLSTEDESSEAGERTTQPRLEPPTSILELEPSK